MCDASERERERERAYAYGAGLVGGVGAPDADVHLVARRQQVARVAAPEHAAHTLHALREVSVAARRAASHIRTRFSYYT